MSAPAADRTAMLLDRLRAAGHRRTALRAVLLDVLGDAGPEHLTVVELHHRLVERGIPADQSAVYRTLTPFTDLGLTHVLKGRDDDQGRSVSDPEHRRYALARGQGQDLLLEVVHGLGVGRCSTARSRARAPSEQR